MKKLTLLSAAITMAASMNTQAALIGAVDLFDIGQEVIATVGAPNAFSSVNGPITSIIGGQRDVAVDIIAGGTDPGARSRVFVDSVANTLSFSNETDVKGQATIQWDGGDSASALDITGLGGLNLIGTGANAFQFETISTDLGFLISIELYTDATHFTQATILTTGPRIDTILFSDLMDATLCGLVTGLPTGLQTVTCGAGGTVDLANLGSIQTILNVGGGTAEVDLKIGKIVTVPEPSVIGLMGAGLLAAGFVGARRRTSTFQA